MRELFYQWYAMESKEWQAANYHRESENDGRILNYKGNTYTPFSPSKRTLCAAKKWRTENGTFFEGRGVKLKLFFGNEAV